MLSQIFPFSHRQDGLVDDVARSLVVNDGAGPKLGDGQEPRPLQELLPLPKTPAHSATRAPARPSTRDERRQRQAREAVAGEKALAGEVTVAVKVGLQQPIDVGEQVHLLLGLGTETFGQGSVDGAS